MQKKLLDYLCDPVDKSELTLKNAEENETGHIISGELVSSSGRTYPIVNGIPRFIENETKTDSIEAFGDQWNLLNYNDFKWAWLAHTVGHTFGSPDHFKGKVVIDSGAGHGMQSKWVAEAGADYVIALELSHAVDGVFQENLKGVENVDVVQCSIDSPPIKDMAIKNGIVMCHNVIQHTPSVEKTATALWACTGEGSEYVMNWYQRYNKGILRKMRFAFQIGLRKFLCTKSERFRYNWCRVFCALRMLPILGWFLEKSYLAVHGDVQGEKSWKKRYRICFVITFDGYGAHEYQHHTNDEEIWAIIDKMQPDREKVLNQEAVFSKPPKIGAGIRVFR